MSQRDYEDFAEDVNAMASFWVVRLGAEDCTPEDRYACDVWRREDPQHEAAYQKIIRGNDYVDRFMAYPEFQERIELARSRTKPPFWGHNRVLWTGAIATFVLILAAGVTVFTLPKPDAPLISAAEAVDTSAAYETQVGERSTVTLSDGSVITINTNSRIEVAFTDHLREVTLVRGQGFFDVAKDVDRPFVVMAAEKRVLALGTVFDVRIGDQNEVQVTLVEGKVHVDDVSLGSAQAEEASQRDRAEAKATIELSPGERLIARSDTAPEVIETDGIEETSWRRGQLVFRQRPLSEVVQEMNRYSTQQLVLDVDERVLALEVSGVFNSGGPPSAFVDALEAIHQLEARRSGRDELVLMWRE